MDFAPSQKTRDYLQRMQAFLAEHVAPREAEYRQQNAANAGADWTRWQVPAVMKEWKAEARAAGLWNLFLPDAELGAGLSTLEYAPLAELMGRDEYTAEIFNCSAPDTGNMEVLYHFGSAQQKARWLAPLLAG